MLEIEKIIFTETGRYLAKECDGDSFDSPYFSLSAYNGCGSGFIRLAFLEHLRAKR